MSSFLEAGLMHSPVAAAGPESQAEAILALEPDFYFPLGASGLNNLGSDATDLTNHSANLTGGTSAYGVAGAAATLNGSSQYLELADNAWSGPGFSMAVWVKRTVTNSYDPLLGDYGVSWDIVLPPDSDDLGIYDQGGSFVAAEAIGAQVTTYQWIGLTMEDASNRLRFYHDGALITPRTEAIDFSTVPSGIFVGHDGGGGGEFFGGSIHDLAIWRRELSQAEMESAYFAP